MELGEHIFAAAIRDAVAGNAALPDHTLVVEVTEGMLLEKNPFVIQQLRQIAAHGIDLALDDFGTGYSSLAYFKKFSFQFLKIDRSFVMHLEAGTTAYALCETIVLMAHKIGMQVLAEGVETPEQLGLLQASCDFGQGCLSSKAVVPAHIQSCAKKIILMIRSVQLTTLFECE